MKENYNIIIIGAGAAGLFCAIQASQRGRKVLLLDSNKKIASKILISGGGRCNFTNLYTEADNYISKNSHFCKSALSRYTQYDFMALLDKYNIAYYEKTLGQLFCKNKAKDIVSLLTKLCEENGVDITTSCMIEDIKQEKSADTFIVKTSSSFFTCNSLVIATGGPSIPKMGASDFGYKIAKQFKLKLIEPQPALVPLILDNNLVKHTKLLAGISVDALVSCGDKEKTFRENILFTHKGLSGPAILQISSYWQKNKTIHINLIPDIDLNHKISIWQAEKPKTELKTLLSQYLSKRLIQIWTTSSFLGVINKPIAQYNKEEINQLINHFQDWNFKPISTEGYRTAEVTRGGVDCNELSSKTFAAKKIPNLYFIGEVIDVTGWLGGYNFQWAWSSGFCAGQYV